MSNIRKETSKTPISVDSIYTATYQKPGTQTAQIRQEITTKSFYPGKQVSNSLNDSLFSATDFGFTEQEYTNKETRVAWLLVPPGSTAEAIQAKLTATPGATLYSLKSNHPILDEQQKYAITNNLTTLDNIANSQVVRYPESNAKAGQVVLDANGKVQYKRVNFSLTPMEDGDNRNSNVTDVYHSAEIAAELLGASVMVGQTV